MFEIFSFQQSLKSITQIPITFLNQEISYNKKNPKFSQEIIEVDQNYLKNSSTSNLEIVSLMPEELPLWILYDFQQNKVRLWGKFPEDFDDPEIKINLFDSKTRLFSPNIIISLKPIENDEDQSYFLHFMIIGLVLIVFLVLVIKLFVKGTPKNT